MSFSVVVMKKERDRTSFESLYPVKKAYRNTKVGHTGTLDRFATGLMIVLTGEATRLNPLFSGYGKSYRACLEFGRTTDTLDSEGQVTLAGGRIPSIEEIRAVLPTFLGTQLQQPPVYSAIHVNGKRAYKEARKGNEVEMPLRQIEITDISIISYEAPFLVFDVSVSKGTYIRALARDIASRLDTVGHLRELERYRVGPFTYSSLTHIPSTEAETESAVSLACRERIDYDPAFLGRVKNGCFLPEGIISATGSGDGYYRLYSEGRFIGIIEKRGGCRVAALTERENL